MRIQREEEANFSAHIRGRGEVEWKVIVCSDIFSSIISNNALVIQINIDAVKKKKPVLGAVHISCDSFWGL